MSELDRRPSGRSRITPAPLLAALTVVGLAAAGCSGGSTPRVASASRATGVVTASPTQLSAAGELAAYIEAQRAWVSCLRGEGINVTDPDAKGNVTFPGLTAQTKADTAFTAAQQKCASLASPAPASLQSAATELTPEQIATNRRYATCMQRSGAPDFPDPNPDGTIARSDSGTARWDPTTAGAQRATRACASIIGDPAATGTGRG